MFITTRRRENESSFSAMGESMDPNFTKTGFWFEFGNGGLKVAKEGPKFRKVKVRELGQSSFGES